LAEFSHHFWPNFHAVFEIIFRPNLAYFDPIFADHFATPFLPIADLTFCPDRHTFCGPVYC
jgi:hypothetical protein